MDSHILAKDLKRGYYEESRPLGYTIYYVIPDLPKNGKILVKHWVWMTSGQIWKKCLGLSLDASKRAFLNPTRFLFDRMPTGQPMPPCVDGESIPWITEPRSQTKGVIKENAYSEVCRSCGGQNKKVELFTRVGYYCPNCEG